MKTPTLFLFFAAAALGLTGCAMLTPARTVDAATMRTSYARTMPDGAQVRFELEHPKDVSVARVAVNPATGELEILDLTSSVSPEAVNAASVESQVYAELFGLGLQSLLTRTAPPPPAPPEESMPEEAAP